MNILNYNSLFKKINKSHSSIQRLFVYFFRATSKIQLIRNSKHLLSQNTNIRVGSVQHWDSEMHLYFCGKFSHNCCGKSAHWNSPASEARRVFTGWYLHGIQCVSFSAAFTVGITILMYFVGIVLSVNMLNPVPQGKICKHTVGLIRSVRQFLSAELL